MKYILLTIISIVLIIIILAAGIFMFAKKDKVNYKIVETKDFSCEGMTGFSFSYPVFKGWEVKGTQNEKYRNPDYKGEMCHIWFNWPENIKFEVPPQLVIEKRTDFHLVETEKLERNPNGVPYNFVFDPSNYVSGYKQKTGQWDYLQFYGPDFGVKFWPLVSGDGYGFSSDVFIEGIIKSFKFI